MTCSPVHRLSKPACSAALATAAAVLGDAQGALLILNSPNFITRSYHEMRPRENRALTRTVRVRIIAHYRDGSGEKIAPMRCPQCGTESNPQAAFCGRCGAKLLEVKPASVREYSIALIRRSYWYYIGQLLTGAVLTCAGGTLIFKGPDLMKVGFALLVIGIVT